MFSVKRYILNKFDIKKFTLKGSSNCIKAILNQEGVKSGWEVFLNSTDKNNVQVNGCFNVMLVYRNCRPAKA